MRSLVDTSVYLKLFATNILKMCKFPLCAATWTGALPDSMCTFSSLHHSRAGWTPTAWPGLTEVEDFFEVNCWAKSLSQ